MLLVGGTRFSYFAMYKSLAETNQKAKVVPTIDQLETSISKNDINLNQNHFRRSTACLAVAYDTSLAAQNAQPFLPNKLY